MLSTMHLEAKTTENGLLRRCVNSLVTDTRGEYRCDSTPAQVHGNQVRDCFGALFLP